MKTWKVFSLAGLVVTSICVWSGPVQAQYFGRTIDQREAAQQQRIHHGIQSGAITPQEARRLGAEQRHIQAAEQRMRADGRLNHRERARLDQMLDKADRHASRQKHDNQVAYSGYGNHNNPSNRHWQQNQRRGHHPGMAARPLPHHGPQFASRKPGHFSKDACRQNPGDRGRSSRTPNRERRLTWNR